MKKLLAIVGAFFVGAVLFTSLPVFGDTINTLQQWISTSTAPVFLTTRNKQGIVVPASSTFSGHLDVTGNLNDSSTAIFNNLTVNGTCTGCGGGSGGGSQFTGGTVTNTISITSGQTTSTLGPGFLFIAASSTNGAMGVFSVTSTNGDVSTSGTLTAWGGISASTSLVVASSSNSYLLGKFYVDASGNVSASGTEKITGLSTFTGGSISNASSSFFSIEDSGNLTVTGSERVANDISASGTMSTNGFNSVGTGLVSGGWTFTGAITINVNGFTSNASDRMASNAILGFGSGVGASTANLVYNNSTNDFKIIPDQTTRAIRFGGINGTADNAPNQVDNSIILERYSTVANDPYWFMITNGGPINNGFTGSTTLYTNDGPLHFNSVSSTGFYASQANPDGLVSVSTTGAFYSSSSIFTWQNINSSSSLSIASSSINASGLFNVDSRGNVNTSGTLFNMTANNAIVSSTFIRAFNVNASSSVFATNVSSTFTTSSYLSLFNAAPCTGSNALQVNATGLVSCGAVSGGGGGGAGSKSNYVSWAYNDVQGAAVGLTTTTYPVVIGIGNPTSTVGLSIFATSTQSVPLLLSGTSSQYADAFDIYSYNNALKFSLDASGTMMTSGSLFVAGSSTFENALTIAGKLQASSTLQTTGLETQYGGFDSIASSSVGNALTVTGQLQASNTMQVAGTLLAYNNANVTGTLYTNTIQSPTANLAIGAGGGQIQLNGLSATDIITGNNEYLDVGGLNSGMRITNSSNQGGSNNTGFIMSDQSQSGALIFATRNGTSAETPDTGNQNRFGIGSNMTIFVLASTTGSNVATTTAVLKYDTLALNVDGQMSASFTSEGLSIGVTQGGGGNFNAGVFNVNANASGTLSVSSTITSWGAINASTTFSVGSSTANLLGTFYVSSTGISSSGTLFDMRNPASIVSTTYLRVGQNAAVSGTLFIQSGNINTVTGVPLTFQPGGAINMNPGANSNVSMSPSGGGVAIVSTGGFITRVSSSLNNATLGAIALNVVGQINTTGTLMMVSSTVGAYTASTSGAIYMNGVGGNSQVLTISNIGGIAVSTSGRMFMTNLSASVGSDSSLCLDTAAGSNAEVTVNPATTCAISSKRFKHDIVDLDVGLDTTMKLRPVSYESNDSNEKNIGLVAEEVNKVEPRLVFFDAGSKTQVRGVKYENLTALLIKAIQELNTWIHNEFEKVWKAINHQQNEIDDLRGQIKELKQQLNSLKK